MNNENSPAPVAPHSTRRSFIAATGMASAALLGSSLLSYKPSIASAAQTARFQSGKKKFAVNDTDILNFALNLEYLEAEFYLRATTGSGLPDADVTGITGDNSNKKDTGTAGIVTGGSQVTFATPLIQQIAEEIAADELAHVLFLRSALGADAVARPALSLDTAFTTAAVAAGVIAAGDTFDPYANEDNFLLAAFIFEDVGVTAYHGGTPYIKNSDYLAAAAGILGTEAYHAGSIRTLLLQAGQTAASIITAANDIAAARAKLDGTNNDDEGITNGSGDANVVDADSNSLVFSRTFQQVLDIVYLGGQASNYGFFPNKLNGVIQ
jgi:hypothetical protein